MADGHSSFLSKINTVREAARASASSAVVDAAQAAAAASDAQNYTVLAQGPDGTRSYDLPRDAVAKWPALLDPSVRYIRLDSIYSLLCGHPITCVCDAVLNDADDRQRLLLAARKIGYTFSPSDLEYIFEVTGGARGVREVSKHLAGMGNRLGRFLKKGKVNDWMHSTDAGLRSLFPDAAGLRSEEVLHYIISNDMRYLAETNVRYPGIISHIVSSYGRAIGKFLADF